MIEKRSSLLVLLLAITAVRAAAQGTRAITVTGAVKQTLTVTAADLARMPRATVTAKNGDIEVVCEGVWLHGVLQRAGVPSGTELRGEALSTCVLAEATDGYQVVFSVADLDPLSQTARRFSPTKPTASLYPEPRDRSVW